MNAVLDAALAYAGRGMLVHPIRAGEKEPASPHGFKDATRDPDTIRAWFANSPRLNVAFATGAASGRWVLDADAGSADTLLDWERDYGGLPDTPLLQTGRGGRQWHFLNPPDLVIPSRVKFATGVDTRGEGGYALLPPSVTEKAYTWLTEGDPALAPSWLIDLVLGRQASPTGLLDEITIEASTLAGAPGAPEGERHAQACRLIGCEIARGTEPTTILTDALAWAKRCRPPMQVDEITGIVGRLLAKQKAKPAATGTENLEDLELPPAEPWPSPPMIALRHGILGEIMPRLEPATEADPVALLTTLLVAFGNAAGRGPHALVSGATRHGVNLFAGITGRSGKGRKGSGLDLALRPLRDADPKWVEDRIVSGLASGEGLVHAVRDPVTRMEPIREGREVVDYGPVVVDPGVEDKRLLVVESELGAALRASRREQSTLSPMLRLAWDGSKLKTLSKNSPETATDPHVSLIGHIVVEELRKLMSDADIYGGLANRFLWILSRRSRLLPDGGDLDDLGDLTPRLAALLAQAKATGRMRRTPAAADLWRHEYARLTSVPETGIVGAALGRGEAITLRLSLLMAILAGRREVDEPDLRAAIDLWDYGAASARLIFGGKSDTPLDARVLAVIRAQAGIGRSAIARALGGKVPARELVDALGRLRDTGAITATTTRTGGRPAETWAVVVPEAAGEPGKDVRSPGDPLLTSFHGYHAPAQGLERRVL
jgi:hypothetical protein